MIYVYDGSFDGLMSAVFDVFDLHDKEASIQSASHDVNLSLYDSRTVETDPVKSDRVQKGLRKLGSEVDESMYKAWLSHAEGVEDLMLAVIRLGFAIGKDPFSRRQEDVVCKLDAICRKVGWEAHRMLQFVRFVRLSEDMYAADIEPEFDVLQLIGNHFHQRFPQNRFLIRNLRHHTAIVSTPAGWHITSLPETNPPLPKSGRYEELWRTYFKTIANESRRNLKLQQHFVQLKYRRHLTEFEDSP